MTIEEKLRLIGFTGFVHLRKEKRDGFDRLFFTSKHNDHWFSIMLVKKEDNWLVEKINGNYEFIDLFKKNEIDIEDIFYFFKNYYYKNGKISDFI